MRALGFAVAALAMVAGGGATRAAALVDAAAGRASDGWIRLAQVIPDTAPAEATTGNPSLAPLKWVGLLAIPDPTDKDPRAIVECTGQFIKPNVVLTAAHCLRDLADNPTGPWPDVTKGTFWLQYQNQEGAPFKILCGAVDPLWSLPGNFASMNRLEKNDAQLVADEHDFAMLLTDGESPTGVMPYMLDWKGKYGYATRVGYASDILNGQIVQKSGGALFFADAIPMLDKSFPGIVVQWRADDQPHFRHQRRGLDRQFLHDRRQRQERADRCHIVPVHRLSGRRGRRLSHRCGVQSAARLCLGRVQGRRGDDAAEPQPRPRLGRRVARRTCQRRHAALKAAPARAIVAKADAGVRLPLRLEFAPTAFARRR